MRTHILILFLVLSNTVLSAQRAAGDYIAQHYLLQERLADGLTFDVMQDRQGFMWFATEADPNSDKAAPLTPRELEIALLVAEGLSTQAMSERLFRSVNTIDTHRKNIFSKLDVHNVAELMNWLRGRGLV